MKRILLTLLIGSSVCASAQKQGDAHYKKYVEEISGTVECLSKTDMKTFESAVLAVLKKDSRLKDMLRGFNSEGGGECFNYSTGHLIDFEYNFGTGGSVTHTIVLVDKNLATEIKFDDSKFPYPKRVGIHQPVIKKTLDGIVTIEGGGYTEDDASCCPSYEIVVQCKIVGNRFVYIKTLEFEKSPS